MSSKPVTTFWRLAGMSYLQVRYELNYNAQQSKSMPTSLSTMHYKADENSHGLCLSSPMSVALDSFDYYGDRRRSIHRVLVFRCILACRVKSDDVVIYVAAMLHCIVLCYLDVSFKFMTDLSFVCFFTQNSTSTRRLRPSAAPSRNPAGDTPWRKRHSLTRFPLGKRVSRAPRSQWVPVLRRR